MSRLYGVVGYTEEPEDGDVVEWRVGARHITRARDGRRGWRFDDWEPDEPGEVEDLEAVSENIMLHEDEMRARSGDAAVDSLIEHVYEAAMEDDSDRRYGT